MIDPVNGDGLARRETSRVGASAREAAFRRPCAGPEAVQLESGGLMVVETPEQRPPSDPQPLSGLDVSSKQLPFHPPPFPSHSQEGTWMPSGTPRVGLSTQRKWRRKKWWMVAALAVVIVEIIIAVTVTRT